MVRSFVNGFLCLLLLGVGVATLRPLNHLVESIDWLGMLAIGIGTVGMLTYMVYCFRLRGSTARIPWFLFLFPALCVGLAFVSMLGSMTWYIPEAEAVLRRAYPYNIDEVQAALASWVLREQQLALLFASLNVFGLVLAASSWGPELPKPRKRLKLTQNMTFWGIVAGGVFFAMAVLVSSLQFAATSGEGLTLPGVYFFTSPYGLKLYSLVCLIWLLSAAAGRVRYLATDTTEAVHPRALVVLGIIAAGIFAGCVLFALAELSRFGAGTTFKMSRPLALLPIWTFPSHEYYWQYYPLFLFPAAALIVTAALLNPVRRHFRSSAKPAALIGGVLLAGAVSAFAGGDRLLAAIDVDVNHVCSNGKQLSQLMRRAPLTHQIERLWEHLDLDEDENLQLPRTTNADDSLVDATLIQVRKDQLVVDDRVVAEVRDGRVVEAERDPRRPLYLPTLAAVLAERCETLKLIAMRARVYRFYEGEASLAIDRTTPMRTVYEIVHTASESNFKRLHFVGRKHIPPEYAQLHPWSSEHRDCPRHTSLRINVPIRHLPPEFVVDDIAGRTYFELLQGEMSPDGTAPLLMLLHGKGKQPEPARISELDTPVRLVWPRAPWPLVEGYQWYDEQSQSDPAREPYGDMENTTARLFELVRRYQRETGVAGKPVVVGIDQGGAVALALAAKYPDVIGAVHVVDGTLDDSLWPMPPWPPRKTEAPSPSLPKVHVYLSAQSGDARRAHTEKFFRRLNQVGYETQLVEYSGDSPTIPNLSQSELFDAVRKSVEKQASTGAKEPVFPAPTGIL